MVDSVGSNSNPPHQQPDPTTASSLDDPCNILLDINLPTMVPEFQKFLYDRAGVTADYCKHFLEPSAITEYTEFKRIFLPASFENLDRIVNAIGFAPFEGNNFRITVRLLLLGWYIYQSPTTPGVMVWEPRSKNFMPQAFDGTKYNKAIRVHHREFLRNIEQSFAVTCNKFKDSSLMQGRRLTSLVLQDDDDTNSFPQTDRTPSLSVHSNNTTARAMESDILRHRRDSHTSLSNKNTEQSGHRSSSQKQKTSSDQKKSSKSSQRPEKTRSSVPPEEPPYDSDSDSSLQTDGSEEDYTHFDDSEDSDFVDELASSSSSSSESSKDASDCSVSSMMKRAKVYAKDSRRKFRPKRYKKKKRLYLRKRSPLTMKSWDGNEATFIDTISHIKHFVSQQHAMHYIVQSSFIRGYKKNQYRRILKRADVSRQQFDADQNTLHAYLSVAFDTYTPSRDLLHKYRPRSCRSADGVKAFDALMKRYGYGGDAGNAQVQRLLTQYRTPYMSGYRGGLKKYVDNFVIICSELDRHRQVKQKRLSDMDKCNQLLANIASDKDSRYIYSSANTTFTIYSAEKKKRIFEKLCTSIRTMAIDTDEARRRDKANIKRHAQMASQLEMHNFGNTSSTNVNEQDVDDYRMVLAATNKGDLTIPKKLWMALSKEMRSQIWEIREKLEQEPQKDVRNAQLAIKDDEDEDGDDQGDSTETDGSEDPDTLEEDERQAMKAFAKAIARELQPNNSSNIQANLLVNVRCDYSLLAKETNNEGDNVFANLSNSLKVARCTIDSGADSCILGKVFRIHSLNPGQFANVYGFDSKHARKEKLPIGTGDAVIKVYDPDDQSKTIFEVIGRWNQSVINSDSHTSLQSDSQTRENGIIIDSVSRRHDKDRDGNKGTQSMTIPYTENDGKTSYVVAPFVLKRDLMTFELRTPSDNDYSKLKIVEMTSSDPWDPRDHTDDNDYVYDAANLPRDIGDVKMERVADNTKCSYDEVEEAFYDTNETMDGYVWYESESYCTQVKIVTGEDIEKQAFMSAAESIGDVNHAVHLTIDYKAMRVSTEDEHLYVRSNDVDEMLRDATWEQLTGLTTGTEFDTLAYTIRAVHQFHGEDDNLEHLRTNFGFRPTEVIRKTLEHTTQFATAFCPFPLHRHWKAMYKWANKPRLSETVCMDTVFGKIAAVDGGHTAAQVYYGVKSHMINIYGMHSKGEAHDTYLDFIREEGIPSVIHRDGSKEQKNKEFKRTNRDYKIRDSWTEPYHPHQNPAETRAIRFLKRVAKALITVTGAPQETWFHALKYVAMINNWTSHESLDWKTPYEKRHGVEPDISPLIAYHFYQPVYYYSEDGNADSREKLGYILGVAENIGSHMTFHLLTDETQQVITRSVLRAIDSPMRNLQIEPSEALDPTTRVVDRENNPEDDTLIHDEDSSNVTVSDAGEAEDENPFTLKEVPHRKVKKGRIKRKVKETLKKLMIGQNKKQQSQAHKTPEKQKKQKIRLRRSSSRKKRKVPHASESDKIYIIDKILDHRMQDETDNKGEYEVLIKWQNYSHRHNSWEPVPMIRETAKRTLAEYAIPKELHKLPEWNWSKAYIPHSTAQLELTPENDQPGTNNGIFLQPALISDDENDQPDLPSVEGRYKRSKSKKKRKNSTQKRLVNQGKKTKSIVGLLATMGLSTNSAHGYQVKNYQDFDDSHLKQPLPTPPVPLETAMYTLGTNTST